MRDNMVPVTVPGNFRPVQIATIHGAGVFLAENPSLPMPGKVELSATVPTLQVLEQIAAAYGSQVVHTEERTWFWATIPVAVEALHGVTIDYTVFYREPETTPMDLPPRGENVLTDPWTDVIPPSRCLATWRQLEPGAPIDARCVYNQGHDGQHFFDDNEGHQP